MNFTKAQELCQSLVDDPGLQSLRPQIDRWLGRLANSKPEDRETAAGALLETYTALTPPRTREQLAALFN